MGAELIVPSTGGSAPSGTGFVRTTGGAFVDPAQPLVPGDMPALQYLRASRITTDQSGSGSYALNTVAYNSLDTNEGSNWSNSSGVLTCNKTGTYLLTFQIYNSNATDLVRIVQVNSVQKYIAWTATNNARRHIMTMIYRFTAGDTLKLVVQASTAPTIAKDETFVEIWLLKEG